jgi:LPS export ABC transporter protein LptC
MSNPRRFIYPAAALVAIGALGWWLVAERGDQTTRPADPDGTRTPRYYANNATLRSYTSDGVLDNAQRLEYYPEGDVWHLTEPRWRRRGDNEQRRAWQARADKGRLIDDETRGRLRGDVRLTTPGRHGPIRLYTDSLSLYLPRDYAETDQTVRIKARHWEHTGTGGHFWIAEERFNLLADAEGIYAEP